MTDPLPLNADVVREQRGYRLSLPVRAEVISVSKRVVTAERVIVRRHPISETARVQTRVKREEVRVDVHGDVERSGPERSDTAI